jgi:hypothetical protein
VRALDSVDIELFEAEMVVFSARQEAANQPSPQSRRPRCSDFGQLTYRNRDLTKANEDELNTFRRNESDLFSNPTI